MRKPLRRTRKRDVTAAPVPKPIWAVNHFYERIVALRATNPRDFDALSPTTKFVLAQYEAQKREAQRLRAIREEADAA